MDSKSSYVMKESSIPEVVQSRLLLTLYNIPLLGTKEELKAATETYNMCMAISHGHLGIHSQDYARAVLDRLSSAVKPGRTHDEIRQGMIDQLNEMKEFLEDGKSFW